jgi:hypothetical protein
MFAIYENDEDFRETLGENVHAKNIFDKVFAKMHAATLIFFATLFLVSAKIYTGR